MDTFTIFGICTFITSILTINGNVLTIVAFIKVRNLRINPSNFLILALSVADLIFGLYMCIYFGIPIVFYLGHPYGEIGCMLSVPFEYIYQTGNFLLVVINVDRVLLVSLDYSKYVKITTVSRVKAWIGVCYVGCFLCALFEISLWKYAIKHNSTAANIDFDQACLFPPRRMKSFGIYISLVFFGFPLISVAILSSLFFHRLRKRTRKVGASVAQSSVNSHVQAMTTKMNSKPKNTANLNVITIAAGMNNNDIDGEDGRSYGGSTSHDKTDDSVARKRYIKSASTLAVLVTAMCISMLPYCIYLILTAVYSDFNSYAAHYIMWYILQLNPFLDPLLYAATQKKVRQFYMAMIRKISHNYCIR